MLEEVEVVEEEVVEEEGFHIDTRSTAWELIPLLAFEPARVKPN